MKLADIHHKYDTDKGTNHSYIEIYDGLFSKLQQKSIQLLEIGALTCGSLKMFEEYFQIGTIYGLDNWAQSSRNIVSGFTGNQYNLTTLIDNINTHHPRIKLIICDSTNKNQVLEKFSDYKFDVIIDDGDHRVESQFITYCNFINYLDTDGIYIVEDVDKYETLKQQIDFYNKSNNLPYSVSIEKLFKNHRPDDVLLVIQKNAVPPA